MAIHSIHISSGTRAKRRAAASGFTLVELMVTIAIAGILAGLALPAFNSFVLGQRVKTASFELFSSLALARSEAIKRNANVSVSPASGGWQNGWTVSTSGTTLNRQAAFSGLTITGATGITYNQYGRLSATATPFTISTSDSNVTARCISIDLSGRPNSKTGSC